MKEETKIQMFDILIKLGEKNDEKYKTKLGLLNDLEKISWVAESVGYKTALNEIAAEIGILK